MLCVSPREIPSKGLVYLGYFLESINRRIARQRRQAYVRGLRLLECFVESMLGFRCVRSRAEHSPVRRRSAPARRARQAENEAPDKFLIRGSAADARQNEAWPVSDRRSSPSVCGLVLGLPRGAEPYAILNFSNRYEVYRRGKYLIF